ncbi:MAG: hypothetical protein P4L43_20335 [Syntrophobacteraceae bacterium]|nr:hypothetical protein [Syntrophobacteraceae bacterium]
MLKSDLIGVMHILDAAREAITLDILRSTWIIVWETVTKDLSPLIARLEPLLAEKAR